MRRAIALLALVLTGCAGGNTVSAQGTTPDTGGTTTWVGGAPAQTQIVVGDAGDTFVGVWIDAPNDLPRARSRAPMAVSLVVDTSGSMTGEKIQNARHATSSLLESLRDGDIVSIYAFSDGVTEIAPPTQVSGATRPHLMRRVGMLTATGSTNMYDGLTVGVARAGTAPASHPVRRVVLISDGHANVGLSDPVSLGDVAARGTEAGVQVTAIGVGLDYDEQTLGALAVRSAGRLYHLAQPYQMAQILEQELQLLAHTVALDAFVEIIPAPGVIIIEGVSLGSQIQNGHLRVPLGSLHAGQQRDVLFRAQVDTAQVGRRPLATARLVYRQPDAQRVVEQEARVAYAVTPDRRAAERSVAPRVSAMVASYQASQAQVRAAEALTRGDQATAVAELDRAERSLVQAAEAAPSSAEGRALRQRAQRVQAQRSTAAAAPSAAAARGAALDAYDDAMEASGY